jgi:hypothetical protein
MLGGEKLGLSAFLWDMLDRDVKGFEPREKIPVTVASTDQKIRNMDPIAQWWYNALWTGDLPFSGVEPFDDWAEGEVRAIRTDVIDSFNTYCRAAGIRHPGGSGRSLAQIFAIELKKVCPGLKVKTKVRVPEDRYDLDDTKDGGRVWAWSVPSLEICRAGFEEATVALYDWPILEDDPLEF